MTKQFVIVEQDARGKCSACGDRIGADPYAFGVRITLIKKLLQFRLCTPCRDELYPRLMNPQRPTSPSA